MNEQTITLTDGKAVKVHRLALGDFGDLIVALEGAFKKLGSYGDIGKMTNNDFVALLPKLLSDSTPEICGALATACDITGEEIQALGLDDVTEILLAFLQQNNIEKIFGNVKKMLDLRKPAPVQEPASANGSLPSPTNSPESTDGAAATSSPESTPTS